MALNANLVIKTYELEDKEIAEGPKMMIEPFWMLISFANKSCPKYCYYSSKV